MDGPVLVDVDHLESHGAPFFGREAELARLDEAWGEPGTRIVSITGPAGAGKSALVCHWLGVLATERWRDAERVMGWSFRAHEIGPASAEAFLNHGLRALNDPNPAAGSPRDRGTRLAQRIAERRTLLILDGLECLQYGEDQRNSRFIDPGMSAFLGHIAVAGTGLCVMTAHDPIADLGAAASSVSYTLGELPEESAVALLRSLGVEGRDDLLLSVAERSGGNALTLTLLGHYLRVAHGGDVGKHPFPSLGQGGKGPEAGFPVVAAWARWLGETRKLSILRLLALFSGPADSDELAALRALPLILGLTQTFFVRKLFRCEPISEPDWQRDVASLREHGLLKPARDPAKLDMPPLLGSFFARELQERSPEAWRSGHLRLYKRLAKNSPDHLDAVAAGQRLSASIFHGCQAGRHASALDIFTRWSQGPKGSKDLRAPGFELAVLGYFFEHRWDRPIGSLPLKQRRFVLRTAGSLLMALDRLPEAIGPLRMAVEIRIGSDFDGAEGDLVRLTLALGNIANAVEWAKWSVHEADARPDPLKKAISRFLLGDALHQAGLRDGSLAVFREGNAQAEIHLHHREGPLLFCDLVLDLVEPEDGSGIDGISAHMEGLQALETECQNLANVARKELEAAEKSGHPINVALANLMLGRVYIASALAGRSEGVRSVELDRADQHLRWSVSGLRREGGELYFPSALLAEASLRRCQGDLDGAAADLSEAMKIGRRSGRLLIECDAHLEWVRLELQRHDFAAARAHLSTARRLIDETGYGRREREVVYLERCMLSSLPNPRRPMKDFFISYNEADRAWAEWIGWTLEEANYSVVLQAWDFRPGGNFVLDMQQAAVATRKTVIVLSDSYLKAEFTQAEWSAAFAQDPSGTERRLIPLRVAKCSPDGLLKSLIYADLVGLPVEEAKAEVLSAVSVADRAKPKERPIYPNSGEAPATPRVDFPGREATGGTALAIWREKLDFLLAQEAIASDGGLRFTLRKQVEEARQKLHELKSLA
jgi:hypothetical protein